METKNKIFITGITGNQGSALAKHLLKQNNSIIGLTRNSNSEKAKHWTAQGVTIIEGDLNNPESYKSHLNEADSIYLMQALQGKDQEVSEGKKFIDSINADNNPYVVYSSVLGADLNSGVPHFESKYEIENYIKSKIPNYSILRPASFYENHLFPRVAKDIKNGKYISPLKKTCSQQMIGLDDIGKIAANVISNKEKYKNKTISIATDEWKINDIPEVFSKAINKPVKYKKLPGFITRLAMGKDLSKMFRYMNQNDFSVVNDIQKVRAEFNIHGDFKSWVNENFSPKSTKD